jgi:hypothetical protein
MTDATADSSHRPLPCSKNHLVSLTPLKLATYSSAAAAALCASLVVNTAAVLYSILLVAGSFSVATALHQRLQSAA